MRKLQMVSISLVLLLFTVVSVSAQKAMDSKGDYKTFYVNDPVKRNSVSFKSTAPLEDIVGVSNDVTGYLAFNPEKPKDGGYGELSVPVKSLNTGIPKRDEHLASEGWMNAAKYPNIVLKINELRNVKEVSSNKTSSTYDITAEGEIMIKGKSKKVEFPARITYLAESEMTKARMPGDLLAVRAELEITLADFGVTGPAGMDIIGSKVGKTVTIEANIMSSSSSEFAMKSDDGKSMKQ